MNNKPNYSISTSVDDDILTVVLTGEVTEDCDSQLQDEVMAIKKSMNYKNVLVDFRALKGRFGASESCSRFKEYPAFAYSIYTAIVDIPEHVDFQSIKVSMALNAGLSYKWFTDIDAAKSWLKSK